MTHWKPITDLPAGRQFVWAMGSHGESFPIVVWTDGARFYPAFVDTPEKGAEPYADDTFARWLPLADLVTVPVNAHAGLIKELELFIAASIAYRRAEDRWLEVQAEGDDATLQAAGEAFEEAAAEMIIRERLGVAALATARGE